jgi:hypothetical protein
MFSVVKYLNEIIFQKKNYFAENIFRCLPHMKKSPTV